VIALVRDVLFERNRPLAFWAARRFRHCAEEDDLGQVALLGLYVAAGAFEAGRGSHFSTFAAECMRRRLVSFVRRERSWRKYVPARLEEPLGRGDDGEARTLLHVTASPLPSPEEACSSPSLPAAIEGVLDGLDGRPRAIAADVLERRFLAEEQETLEAIARRHGVSRARVGQVEGWLARRLAPLLGEEAA
jgi:RNA polymerase sigma factor (sigma-70 family)